MRGKALVMAIVVGALALTLAGCGAAKEQQAYVSKANQALSDAAAVRDAANSRIASTDPAAAPAAAEGEGAAATQPSTTYEEILADYTTKMKAVTPRLVEEFKSEAEGLRGNVSALAELSNNKTLELAAINNEGISEMAKLMRSKGDPSSTYDQWSAKLMDVYTSEAQQITDAYVNAAR